MKTVELNLTGLHCAGCAAGIKGTLSGMEGVEKIDADFASAKGAVTFDESKTSLDALIAKIEELGYGATESEEEAEKKK